MASTHERMNTDYLWVRDHSYADSDPKARTHGYNYLYYHAPNKRERLEMMYRSMGKQHDWELEKFRLGKKFPDRGNKKRIFKNLFRFIKNPVGFLFWKTYKIRTAKGRFMTTCMGFGFLFTLIKYKKTSMAIAKKNAYMQLAGKNREGGNGLTSPGYNHQQFAKQQMPLTSFFFHDLPGHKIVVSPSRDQNYRKYFEMRKRHGITN